MALDSKHAVKKLFSCSRRVIPKFLSHNCRKVRTQLLSNPADNLTDDREIGNESVPKIIINNTINLFSEL